MLQENEHLKKFQVTWELHNKHLFESLVFSEPILHGSLPALVAQLKYAPLVHGRPVSVGFVNPSGCVLIEITAFFFFSLRSRQGTASHDSYSEDMYKALLDSLHALEQEMKAVAAEWTECRKRIDDYVDEQVEHFSASCF